MISINKISNVSRCHSENSFTSHCSLSRIFLGQNISFEGKLERKPKRDEFVICQPQKAFSTLKAQAKTIKPVNLYGQTLKKFDTIQKEKILTDEVMYFLKPRVDAHGNEFFTKTQTEIIWQADAKIAFFKDIAKELSQEAEKYGDDILEKMQTILGGNQSLGKYLKIRKKDEVSIYNKLIKEFKNERIKTSVHDIFAKKLYKKRYFMLDKTEKALVKLCIEDGEIKLDAKDYKIIENAFKSDPKEYWAKEIYGKTYLRLSKQEKMVVNDKVYLQADDYSPKTNTTQARFEAINWVRDLVGVRLNLPNGSREEMELLEKYLDTAVEAGDLKITRISNYHANNILPYISKEKTLMWKELIPGMELVETAEVRKKNGYTTTQMNLEYSPTNRERPVLVEFQIRTESLNFIGNCEHLIYDILEGKDITKGIKQLADYYKKIGIVDTVKSVFNNPEKESRYIDYERAYYSYVRNNEINGHYRMEKPKLSDYGLGEYEDILSIDALKLIDEEATKIKNIYKQKAKTNNTK